MIEIKACPICGSNPEPSSKDMGTGGGHGYPGNTNYKYTCPKCGMLYADADDLYDDGKSIKAPQRAIIEWNKKVDKVLNFLKEADTKSSKVKVDDKSSKEMFEELGYNQSVIKDDKITYTRGDMKDVILTIVFDLKRKSYLVYNDYISRATPMSQYILLHKAINKQLEELKWI